MADAGVSDERAARSISTRCAGRRARRRNATLLALLGVADDCAASAGSYRQYDHMVQTNTINLPGHRRRRRAHQGHRSRARDVGRRQRPLLLPRSVARRDAGRRRSGAQRRLRRRASRWPRPTASTSAIPSGRRSCGSSRRRSKASARRAARSDVPITGGNVSLYNETDGRAIYPTPVIGVVGLLEHADRVVDATLPGSRRRRSCCSARAAASSAAASI